MSNNLMRSLSLLLLMLISTQIFYGANMPKVVVLDTGRELQLAFDTGRAPGALHQELHAEPRASVCQENILENAVRLNAIRQQKEKEFASFQAPTPDSNPHVWAPTDSASVHSTHHNYWGSVKSKCASGIYKSWEISKDALGKCKEGSKWFLSFAAPVGLAVGHGLLNNFLARKTGQLRQEPFFAASLYEFPIGLSALALHALLGKNLYQKLYDKLYENPYRDHSEGAAAFAVVYLLISGSLQNVSERLPMRGTGWRLPMFGERQTLFDAMFSNVSLFAAMNGALIGGMVALGKLPDWLERGSYG